MIIGPGQTSRIFRVDRPIRRALGYNQSPKKSGPLWPWVVVLLPAWIGWLLIPTDSLATDLVIRWTGNWTYTQGLMCVIAANIAFTYFITAKRKRVVAALGLVVVVFLGLGLEFVRIQGRIDVISRLPISVLEAIVAPQPIACKDISCRKT